MPIEESGSEIVSGCVGVDDVHVFGRHVYLFVALADVCSTCSHLHDGYFAASGQISHSVLFGQLGEGVCLVFVGEHDVDVSVHDVLQEVTVMFHDVVAGHVEADSHASSFPDFQDATYQAVVLHQVAFDE